MSKFKTYRGQRKYKERLNGPCGCFYCTGHSKEEKYKLLEQVAENEIQEVFLEDVRDAHFCDTCTYSPRNLNKIECAECDDYDNYECIIK